MESQFGGIPIKSEFGGVAIESEFGGVPVGNNDALPGNYSDINKSILEEFGTQQSDEQSTTAGTLGISPHKTGYELGEAALKGVVRPVVEGSATIAGSVYGSPIIGGSIAYAASNQLMDLVEDYYAQEFGGKEPEQRTVIGELGKVGSDVALIASTGAAFKYAPKIIDIAKGTPGYIFETLPKRLVSSSLKMPATNKWIKTLPSKEVSKQMATVEEVIKSDIPISEKGLSQAKQLRDEIHTFIDDTTKILSENPNNKIKLNKAIANGMKRAYKKAISSSDPKKAMKMLKEIKKGLQQHGTISTPHKANALKRQLYDEVQWFIEGLDPTVTTAKKGVAREIMKQIEKMHPTITAANKTFAARMGVVEALEKSLVRLGSSNIIPLPAKVMATGVHPKLGMLEYVLGRPRVKTQIAQWLSKRRPDKFSKFIYPEKPLGYTPPVKKIESEVYRYLPKIKYAKSPNIKSLKTEIQTGEKASNIKTKIEVMRSNDKKAIEKQIDLAFARQEAATVTTGSPLIMPKNVQTKSIAPSQLKTTLRPAEIKQIIRTKVAERIEKEEAIRAKHLEIQFRKQEYAKTLKGSKLIKPDNTMHKPYKPLNISKRIKK